MFFGPSLRFFCVFVGIVHMDTFSMDPKGTLWSLPTATTYPQAVRVYICFALVASLANLTDVRIGRTNDEDSEAVLGDGSFPSRFTGVIGASEDPASSGCAS